MARAKKETALTPEERLQAALVPDWEWPYKLPKNWCWTTVGTICDGFQYGYTEKATFEKIGPHFIRITDIGDGIINDSGAPYCKIDSDSFIKYKINKDDILIARMGSVGENGLATHNIDGVFASYLIRIVPRSNAKYVCNFLQTNLYWGQISEKAQGTTRLNVNANVLKNLIIPLPPLAEQQRIVDRIESLFAKLDEAKEKAQAVVDSFETRKAAILHKAFTGELTAKWREEHNISKTTWGEKKWGDFLQSIEAGKNWSAEGRPPEGAEFGVVKVSAVTWGEFDELESKTCVVAEQWNSKTQIHKGDFLFSRANTLQLVGNCVIVRNISKRLMLSDKILRFKFDEIAHPRFVLYFTRSRIYREQVEQLASGNQDGMRNISQKNLKLVFFPIPTVVEQIEIISILDRAFAKEQQAKEAAEAVLDQIDLMKKSILARAFRGEMGTNDPSEESAVELIKQIKQDSLGKISGDTLEKKRVKKKVEVGLVAKSIMQVLSAGAKLTPENLKAETALPIDDFYDQLKILINGGHVIETRIDGESYLEAKDENR